MEHVQKHTTVNHFVMLLMLKVDGLCSGNYQNFCDGFVLVIFSAGRIFCDLVLVTYVSSYIYFYAFSIWLLSEAT